MFFVQVIGLAVEVSKAKKIYRPNFEPKVILNPFTQRNSQWAIFSNLFQFSVLLAWFPEGIKNDEGDKAKSRRGTLLRHFIYSVSH